MLNSAGGLAMARAAQDQDEIHQHSGWLIPLGIGFLILALCGLFLAWYLRPGPRPHAAPTSQPTPVRLSLRGLTLVVPANYIENAAARRGGTQDGVALTAIFPGMEGYSAARANVFRSNAPDSPVIHILLRADPGALAAHTRLDRIYRPYIETPGGTPGPFGLTRYTFRSDSGYARNDLYAGTGSEGLLLFLCQRASPDLPSPNCIAIDRPLGPDLGFSYRFKRAYLGRWRDVAMAVDGLIARFAKR
jgi:hypothetical protein